MLGGHDEVEESDRLVEELMVVEHGLLQELALPLREPRGQLFEFVIVKQS